MKDAVSSLRRGMCVVYPTSTQPALGCLPTSEALDLLYSLKNREDSQPVSLAVANLEQAKMIAHVPDSVVSMLDHFPTGSITVILDSRSTLDERLGGERVALRVVSHDTAVRLVEEVGPITATSANISGSPPEDDPAMAARSLSTDGSHIPFVSGLCGGGVPSTLISWQSSTHSPDTTGTKVLREGLVKKSEVFDWLKSQI
jgi:L-threonylcarbamoyladenylate synthase|tara:strand:+ start:145 stop:747 length:603 start_codon:yes stop_codon:yes gene_type:complete